MRGEGDGARFQFIIEGHEGERSGLADAHSNELRGVGC